MSSLRITPRGRFSLAASARFLEGFAPAAHGGADEAGVLPMAFPLAEAAHSGGTGGTPSWAPVGVAVRQERDGTVVADVVGGGDPDVMAGQLARVLSLDVDGSGFGAVGRRDPVIGVLEARYPGLRPVTFHSPYEAAAWAVLSQRVRIVQAAARKQQLAEHLGDAVEVAGRTLHAFPAPAALATGALDSLPDRVAERLRAVAAAALDGVLDAGRLRALPRDQALAELQTVPGIGPFSADLVLIRGAGDPDAFPTHERRLHQEMAARYDLGQHPDGAALAEVAERWRPYRSWCSVLLRVAREEETREIRGPIRT